MSHKTFGLIGYPLSHSFSKSYFTKKFNDLNIAASYQNFPMEQLESIRDLAENNPSLCGLNVTIPHKKAIIEQMDDLSDTVLKVGAMNTIKIDRSNGIKLIGHNTDIPGFKDTLPQLYTNKKALILGSGGASLAVKYVLEEMDIECLTVSRDKQKGITYTDIDEDLLKDCELIVNTTPLGMFPKVNAAPDFPYPLLSKQHILYDLIYNPQETLFLKKGKSVCRQTFNGLQMLINQAEYSYRIWTEDD